MNELEIGQIVFGNPWGDYLVGSFDTALDDRESGGPDVEYLRERLVGLARGNDALEEDPSEDES